MAKSISMRDNNSGLTVKINLWSLEKYLEGHDALSASLHIRGQVTHADTGEVKKFQHPGELLTILARWNNAKFTQLKVRAKASSSGPKE